MHALKILVYVDHKARGQWAVSLAQELAQGLHARVILLTVEQNLKSDPELLERAAAAIKATTGDQAIMKTRPGPARKAILEESLSSSPAVTIFPPAGRRGLARMFKGSRVKSVVHNSPSTVAIARQPVSEKIGRILVTVSGGPMSETTLLSAHEVAQALDTELAVLHVSSSVPIPVSEKQSTGASQIAADAKVGADSEVPDSAEEGVPEISELLARLPWKDNRRPELRLRTGMVVGGILDECQQGHYDLLILGQHLAVKEAGGPLSENIAEILAMECPIPVLIVRPRRWATS